MREVKDHCYKYLGFMSFRSVSIHFIREIRVLFRGERDGPQTQSPQGLQQVRMWLQTSAHLFGNKCAIDRPQVRMCWPTHAHLSGPCPARVSGEIGTKSVSNYRKYSNYSGLEWLAPACFLRKHSLRLIYMIGLLPTANRLFRSPSFAMRSALRALLFTLHSFWNSSNVPRD